MPPLFPVSQQAEAYQSYSPQKAEAIWQSSGKAGNYKILDSTSYGASANFQQTENYGSYTEYGASGKQAQGTWQSSYQAQRPKSGQRVGATSMGAVQYEGVLSREEFQQVYGGSRNFPPGSIYEGAVDVQFGEGQLISERVLEEFVQTPAGVKPVYIYEKVVEVPQVIVKEVWREVPRPEIIERIIEVPKTEVQSRQVVGPPQVQYEEQIIEVPQVVIEERVVHVPRREIRERLIEVPKVEFEEKIEYEDFIEYREVPVDRVVEVPEIEYRVREVEQFVPQTFMQDYYVDRYEEVPITQVQEVERIEQVPVPASMQFLVPRGTVKQAGAPQVPAGTQFLVPRGSLKAQA